MTTKMTDPAAEITAGRAFTPDRCPHDHWTPDGAECLQCGELRVDDDPRLYAELAHVTEAELRALWGDR